MITNCISLGRKVKAFRKRRGFSQLKLSEMIDRSPTYISYIERGSKCMSLNTLILLANALNVSADELLSDSLENTIKVSAHDFADLLLDCSKYEIKILLDIGMASKKSLRENKGYFER